MHATSHVNQSRRHSPARRLDSSGAVPRRIEFEEIDDFAGDAADVASMIERDGRITPDLGSFDLE